MQVGIGWLMLPGGRSRRFTIPRRGGLPLRLVACSLGVLAFKMGTVIATSDRRALLAGGRPGDLLVFWCG